MDDDSEVELLRVLLVLWIVGIRERRVLKQVNDCIRSGNKERESSAKYRLIADATGMVEDEVFWNWHSIVRVEICC